MVTNGFNDLGNVGTEGGVSMGSVQEILPVSSPQEQLEEAERKARVNAAWEQMNKGASFRRPEIFTNKPSSKADKMAQKAPPSWMMVLGLAPKNVTSHSPDLPQKNPNALQNGTSSSEAKRLAAVALSAVRDAAAAAATSRGKVEITEVRDFAGEEIEVRKLVDADSKEAAERAKVFVGQQPSAVDAVLEQIKKKQKLSVLDKTKKDWGEFKEENKGVEEELECYKKSSNQYLDKVSFLNRADHREFERERDARLALQAKRKATDM